MESPTFEYVLQRPDGKCYTGAVRENEEENWTSKKNEAYTFTAKGAAYKKRCNQQYFNHCKIIHIENTKLKR